MIQKSRNVYVTLNTQFFQTVFDCLLIELNFYTLARWTDCFKVLGRTHECGCVFAYWLWTFRIVLKYSHLYWLMVCGGGTSSLTRRFHPLSMLNGVRVLKAHPRRCWLLQTPETPQRHSERPRLKRFAAFSQHECCPFSVLIKGIVNPNRQSLVTVDTIFVIKIHWKTFRSFSLS
jgi:hypothetical protein